MYNVGGRDERISIENRFPKEEQMKIKEDDIILSTGKRLYANYGIIGLSPPHPEYGWQLSGGYDCSLEVDDDLTLSEKIEIADYMIELWKRYKAAIEGELNE